MPFCEWHTFWMTLMANLVPIKLLKTRKLYDYLHVNLKRQREEIDLALDDILQIIQAKIVNVMGPLWKVWCRIDETIWRGFTNFDLEVFVLWTYIQTRKTFNLVPYKWYLDVLTDSRRKPNLETTLQVCV